MAAKKIIRKTLSSVLAAGATVAMGFLSFAGVYLLAPSLILGVTALVMAAAYEGQVYNESISLALRRIFDLNYTKKALASDFITDKISELTKQNLPLDNLFLKAYDEQKKYVAELEKTHHLTKELKKKKSLAKKALAAMEENFIAELKNESTRLNRQQRAMRDIIGDLERDKLIARINRKKWLMSMSWIFAIGGGISSGFAAYNAIVVNMAKLAVALPFLAAIPSGVLLTLGIFAAVGYTLLFYQTMTDIIQAHGADLKKYFKRRVDDGETMPFYVARMIGITVVLALGLFATAATAGTWWTATQQGALLFKLGDVFANVVRNITVPLMTFAEFVYNFTNSFSSVDKISRSDYSAWFNDKFVRIKEAWQTENLVEFFNVPRMLDTVLMTCARGVFFALHVVSMGAISDGLDGVPPDVSTGLNAANELPVDFNYLPSEISEHIHIHASLLLDVVFFPITAISYGLKFLQVGWDALLAGLPWDKAFPKAFNDTKLGHYLYHSHEEVVAPAESEAYVQWNSTDEQLRQRLLAQQQVALEVVVEPLTPPVVATPPASPRSSIVMFPPAPVQQKMEMSPEEKKEEYVRREIPRRRTNSAHV